MQYPARFSGGVFFRARNGDNPGMPWRALIISLFIHLLLSLGVRSERPPSLAEGPATRAVLTMVLTAAPSQSAQHDAREPAGVAPKAGTVHPARKRLPRIASNRQVPNAVPVLPPDSRSTAGNGEAAPRRNEAAPAPASLVPATATVREVPAADGLREYRLALAREARRFKRYPPVARERGWAGQVSVLVSVPLVGASPVISLAGSSGFELLDNQALEMIGLAARSVSLPDTLRGSAFSMLLPVRYSLEDN